MRSVVARSGRTTSPTLTFLFTDIEGHSALWEEHPDAMSEALEDHDRLVASAVRRADGTLVKNAGDGAMAVFADSRQAVGAAVAIQRALAAREWFGIGHLRVRMGLNVGVADARDGDYFGPEVIRAARLCHAANAGQILASRAVMELAPDTSWVDLGSHRLRGFAAPMEVHQVVVVGLPARFPALATLDVHPNTLPRFRTEFFGREREITEIVRLVADHRLVTLTGVGGTGKTRLAVEVAHDQLSSFADGVYFADLSVLGDADRLWDAIASAIGLQPGGMGPSEPASALVLRFLSTRLALLVLDNCEHLLDSVGDVVDDILDAGSDVHVLATSREGLHTEGERLVQVPSLPVETDALGLFRDRALASGATDVDDDTAMRICERLDGLPLAIELAAARCGQLGTAQVAQRLNDRFHVLTGSRRRVPRQRTLEATLDWSHDLLRGDEQAALRRLAVFRGSFSLNAAESVTGASADLIGALVDKSLVQLTDHGRFRLLETVRAYAENRLLATGEAETIRRAHVDWLLEQIASFADEEVVLATSDRSDEFVVDELENLYASLDWLTAVGDWSTVAALASYGGLADGLEGRDSFRPLVRYLWEALDHEVDESVRYRALVAYTSVAYLDPGLYQADLWTEVGELAWRRGDGLAVVALVFLANALDARSRATGDESGIEFANRLFKRAAGHAHDLGPHWEVLPTVFEMTLALNASDWARAADRADALQELRQRGNLGKLSAWVFWTEAVARLASGRPLERHEIEHRLAFVRRNDPGPWAEVHAAALAAPDPSRPRQPIRLDRRSLDRANRPAATAVLISVAALAARDGDWHVAARLLAAARTGDDVFSTPQGVARYRLTTPQVRAALDRTVRHALILDAQQLGISHAIDEAVTWLADIPAP